MALPRVFVRNILARVGEADLWALLRGFGLEFSVTRIHAVRKPPTQVAEDSPMLVYFECKDDSSCNALISLLNGQHYPGICKYALVAEVAIPRTSSTSKSQPSRPTVSPKEVGPRPRPALVPTPPNCPPPWFGVPIPPPPPVPKQEVRPAQPVQPLLPQTPKPRPPQLPVRPVPTSAVAAAKPVEHQEVRPQEAPVELPHQEAPVELPHQKAPVELPPQDAPAELQPEEAAAELPPEEAAAELPPEVCQLGQAKALDEVPPADALETKLAFILVLLFFNFS